MTVGPLDVDIAWGGYYASVDSKSREVSVFSLLDFNRDAYHASLYQERFTKVPTLRKVMRLQPYILHVPIDAKGLLHRERLQLLGARPLSLNDIRGYMVYLEEMEVPETERDALASRVVGFSQGPPMRLTLGVVDDELTITERTR